VVTDPALARVIGFFNIYHQMWESIERRKILMHCRNATFIHHEEFSKYMKVEGVMSEDIFYYLFDLGVGKFLSKKEKNIYMNYLKSGIQSILKLMKTLMMDLKIILEMKAY